MFLSKIWVVLISVVAILFWSMAFLAPKSALREGNRALAESLDRVQHNTELMLRLQSRDWIDAAASIARDRGLVETLDQSSDLRGNIDQIKAQASARLLSLTSTLDDESRPSLMIAVNAKGKQICRIGYGENRVRYGLDGLIGYPLVDSALRGYLRDDTWNIDGKLFFMVASPVISRVRGRYVGAILLGREINNKYAEKLKARLGGTDIVFYLRGTLVASTLTLTTLNKLPLRFSDLKEQIVKDGRSTAIRIGSDETAKQVIMAPLLGEAAAHEAFYAVIGPPPSQGGLGTLLGQITGQDLGWSQFPWLLLSGCLVLFLAISIGLLIWENDLPSFRLLTRIKSLAKREISRINDREFSGKMGSIARAVNELSDRLEKRSASAEGKNLNKILGSPDEPSAKPKLRMDPSFSPMPPLVERKSAQMKKFDFGAEDNFPVAVVPRSKQPATNEASPRELSFDVSNLKAAPPPDAEDLATEVQPSPPKMATRPAPAVEPDFMPPLSLPPEEGDLSLGPLSELPNGPSTSNPALEDRFSLEPSLLGADVKAQSEHNNVKLSLEDAESPSSISSESLPPLVSMEPSLNLSNPEPASGSQAHNAPNASIENYADLLHPSDFNPDSSSITTRSLQEKDTAVNTPHSSLKNLPPADSTPEPESATTLNLEEYFQQIYNAFISVKRQCGEKVENLTYERFKKKLVKNRENLIERYSCKSVKFQVYIKDGKAAIKATPVKE